MANNGYLHDFSLVIFECSYLTYTPDKWYFLRFYSMSFVLFAEGVTEVSDIVSTQNETTLSRRK